MWTQEDSLNFGTDLRRFASACALDGQDTLALGESRWKCESVLLRVFLVDDSAMITLTTYETSYKEQKWVP